MVCGVGCGLCLSLVSLCNNWVVVLDGAVEEPHCVLVRRTKSRVVNRYNVKLRAIWCKAYKLCQVVFNPVCRTMHYLVKHLYPD
jgi:hypothetical protein